MNHGSATPQLDRISKPAPGYRPGSARMINSLAQHFTIKTPDLPLFIGHTYIHFDSFEIYGDKGNGTPINECTYMYICTVYKYLYRFKDPRPSANFKILI